MEDNDIGNGSILMPFFLDYCKKTDAQYIHGELSSVDKSHFDRSIHFYEKHGFKCKLNDEKTSGSIHYDLSVWFCLRKIITVSIGAGLRYPITPSAHSAFDDGSPTVQRFRTINALIHCAAKD